MISDWPLITRSACTGWAAVWCPVCGDCACGCHPDGERIEPPSAVCPLHGEHARHDQEVTIPPPRSGSAS